MVVVGPTLVIVRRVLDGRGEDADLAEEHGDQEGGASGVGGGGQQVGDPGGEGEHRGGDEVDEDVLPVPAHQLHLEPHHGVPLRGAAPRLLHGLAALQVADSHGVAADLGGVQHLVWRPGGQVGAEQHGGVPLVEAGEPQAAGSRVEGELAVVDGTREHHLGLNQETDFCNRNSK